ncbi:MlaD family protein [Aliidiomarina sanyensis]|uniref:MCE family protein n=1 Tax=Aliidiomarina sanyensis TaxID=1249555 RepID=A0A432WS92_9GAMM|nr:MlaD family protein [Aliidiomarina sanyensis]RUO36643.1 MCE family protein [Aliidiomarina sanyensis]
METRANYIFIGLISLLLLFGSISGILWLSKKGDQGNIAIYDVLFREAVTGLSTGSPVQFSGIRVGEVDQLSLDPDDPRVVRARIHVAASTPVDANTRARLTLLNITGASGIELQPGPVLAEARFHEPGIPVIEAEPSPFTRLRLSSEELLVKLGTFLDSTIALVSEENTQKISNILENLERFSENINTSSAQFDQTLEEVNQLLNQFSGLATRVEELLDDQGSATFADVRVAMAQFAELSERFNSLLTDNEAAIQSGFDGINDIGPAVNELRQALAAMGMILQQIDQNPAAYFFGREQLKEIKE